MNQSNNSQLVAAEGGQYLPVQSHNLDIVPYSAQSDRPEDTSMNIESLYGVMIQRVKDLGEYCRTSWTAVDGRIERVEGQVVTIDEAIHALVNKDAETTKIISEQMQFAENATQALNWLKDTHELTKTETQNNLQKLADCFGALNRENENLPKFYQDIRNLNVSKELVEDKLNQFNQKLEAALGGFNNLKSQMNSISSRLTEIETGYKKHGNQADALEDKLQIVEKRLKETQKSHEIIQQADERIREHGRDLLVLNEDMSKLRKMTNNIEEKSNKSMKKLTQNEKSRVDDIDASVCSLKERVSAMETTVEHLNEVKFEDFARRFKKEIFENNESLITKVSKNIVQLEEQTSIQCKTNDTIQKNLQTLQKKVDSEILKIQDIKYTQEAQEKWNRTESRLEELNANLEALLKKAKQHDQDILGLSENVYDYSFKEMASSFDERVDNRLASLKLQMKEVLSQITNLNKATYEENNSSLLINKLQKMVENKLEAHIDLIDQKLLKIASNNSAITSVPSETEDGKKILYKVGKSFVDPCHLKVSVDGSVKWNEKCRYGVNCDRVFCQRDHGEKICPQGPSCLDQMCKMRHPSKEQKRNDSAAPLSKNNRGHNSYVSRMCKYGDKCENQKCISQHKKEACGGFTTCKKKDCKRRHHPSRVVPVLNQNKREKKSSAYDSQKSLYWQNTPLQYPLQSQGQYLTPQNFPWYGFGNAFPPIFSSQIPWYGGARTSF